jgi:hypothetical protein
LVWAGLIVVVVTVSAQGRRAAVLHSGHAEVMRSGLAGTDGTGLQGLRKAATSARAGRPAARVEDLVPISATDRASQVAPWVRRVRRSFR